MIWKKLHGTEDDYLWMDDNDDDNGTAGEHERKFDYIRENITEDDYT